MVRTAEDYGNPTLYYLHVDEEPEEGDEFDADDDLSPSDWTGGKAITIPVVVHSWFEYSDNSPDRSRAESNLNAMLKATEGINGVWLVYGYNDYHALAIRADLDDPEVLDALDSLEDYPLLDEDAAGELEIEYQDAAWSSWVRNDFARLLVQRYAEIAEEDGIDIEEWVGEALDAEDDDPLRDLFGRGEPEWREEAGGMTIDVQRVVDRIESDVYWEDVRDVLAPEPRPEPREPVDAEEFARHYVKGKYSNLPELVGKGLNWPSVGMEVDREKVKRLIKPHGKEIGPAFRAMCERAIEFDREAGGLYSWEDEEEANTRACNEAALALGIALMGEPPAFISSWGGAEGKQRYGWGVPVAMSALGHEVLPLDDEVDPEYAGAGDVEPLSLKMFERWPEILRGTIVPPGTNTAYLAIFTAALGEDDLDELPLLKAREH
jgi:hypothetical protein